MWEKVRDSLFDYFFDLFSISWNGVIRRILIGGRRRLRFITESVGKIKTVIGNGGCGVIEGGKIFNVGCELFEVDNVLRG